MRGREALETRLTYSRCGVCHMSAAGEPWMVGLWTCYSFTPWTKPSFRFPRICELVIHLHPGRNQASDFHEFHFSLLMIATSLIRFCGSTGINIFGFLVSLALVPAYRHLNRQKKWPHEILGTTRAHVLSRISRGQFFLADFFRVSLHGLSEAGTTGSLHGARWERAVWRRLGTWRHLARHVVFLFGQDSLAGMDVSLFYRVDR